MFLEKVLGPPSRKDGEPVQLVLGGGAGLLERGRLEGKRSTPCPPLPSGGEFLEATRPRRPSPGGGPRARAGPRALAPRAPPRRAPTRARGRSGGAEERARPPMHERNSYSAARLDAIVSAGPLGSASAPTLGFGSLLAPRSSVLSPRGSDVAAALPPWARAGRRRWGQGPSERGIKTSSAGPPPPGPAAGRVGAAGLARPRAAVRGTLGAGRGRRRGTPGPGTRPLRRRGTSGGARAVLLARSARRAAGEGGRGPGTGRYGPLLAPRLPTRGAAPRLAPSPDLHTSQGYRGVLRFGVPSSLRPGRCAPAPPAGHRAPEPARRTPRRATCPHSPGPRPRRVLRGGAGGCDDDPEDDDRREDLVPVRLGPFASRRPAGASKDLLAPPPCPGCGRVHRHLSITVVAGK